jgi:hypothetical protein
MERTVKRNILKCGNNSWKLAQATDKRKNLSATHTYKNKLKIYHQNEL